MFFATLCTNGELKNHPTRRVIPGGENFPIAEPNFTNTVSTIMVESVIAPQNVLPLCLGKTDAGVLCTGMMSQGDRGIEELRGLARALIKALEAAIPEASGKQQTYFEELLSDAKTHGLEMPVYGRIPLD